ncbi:MAG: hypothetical protein WA144_01245 [Candidatus Methanoperedens sp.]
MEVEKLYFVASIIRKDKWRYNYGRKITPIRLKPLQIDFSEMDEESIKKIRRTLLKKVETLKKEFKIKNIPSIEHRTDKIALCELFDIKYGQRELHSKDYLEFGNTLVISSQGTDNGCYGFYNIEAKYKNIIISAPSTGSIGMSFVQEYPCSIDDNCLVLTPKGGINLSIEEIYFITSLIRLDSWRYRYGRQVTSKRLGKLVVDFSEFDYAKTKSIKENINKIINSEAPNLSRAVGYTDKINSLNNIMLVFDAP